MTKTNVGIFIFDDVEVLNVVRDAVGSQELTKLLVVDAV